MEKSNSIEARMFYNLFCEKKEKYLVAGQKYKYLAAFYFLVVYLVSSNLIN